jgi:hypothetical protein
MWWTLVGDGRVEWQKGEGSLTAHAEHRRTAMQRTSPLQALGRVAAAGALLLVLQLLNRAGTAAAQDVPLKLNVATSLESANYPDYYIRHQNSLGRITHIDSDLDQQDSRFIPRPGLNGMPGTVSFESVNYPNHFLRHQDYRLKLHRSDSSELFRQDATFHIRPGLNRLPYTASFESVNFPNHYIRHSAYQLWIALNDNSDLFRDDASFRPADASPGRDASFESLNFPEHFIRHRNALGELTRVAPESMLDRQDATFVVRPALSGDRGAVSFEAVNYPGHFLRHQDFRLKLHRDDGSNSDLFRKDASFYRRPGLADGNATSFEAVNFRGRFIRHRDFHLWVEQNDNSELFRRDATFREPRLSQNTGRGLYVHPRDCATFFRSRRVDEGLESTCLWIMGIEQSCRARDAFVAEEYDSRGAFSHYICSANWHESTFFEELEHLVRGIGQGLATAYQAAAPYFGLVVSGVACVKGVLYACATLALDIADLVGAPAAGVAGDAIHAAAQMEKCIDGNLAACAAIGGRGARLAGVNIPGKDPGQIADDAKKCDAGDFAACARLGQAAGDAAGVPVGMAAGNAAKADDCLNGNDAACAALGREAAQQADVPLGGVPQGAENAAKCRMNDNQACIQLGKALVEAAGLGRFPMAAPMTVSGGRMTVSDPARSPGAERP